MAINPDWKSIITGDLIDELKLASTAEGFTISRSYSTLQSQRKAKWALLYLNSKLTLLCPLSVHPLTLIRRREG